MNVPLDPSRKAEHELTSALESGVTDDIVVLDESIRAREEEREAENEVSVSEDPTLVAVEEAPLTTVKAEEARTAEPVLEQVSERDAVRLLLFTKNSSLLVRDSFGERRLLELGRIFAEIHVVILKEESEEEIPPVIRLTDNIWLYPTESTAWWKTPYDAYRVAKEQLVFAGGFRADVVVAEDPFESGIAAHFIAEKYERTLQVHILEDIYSPEFAERDAHNSLRLMLAKYVLKRTQCVRTSTEYIKSHVVATFPDLAPFTESLPVYYNLSLWRDLPPTFDLKQKYPQFKFVILTISSMTPRSHTVEVLHACASILLTHPTVGLVIVGSGPLRGALEKRVVELGLQNHVVFEPMSEEVISHMKTANVLMHMSEDADEDPIVLEAASAKLPIIGAYENIAGALFQDGESALLAHADDLGTISKKLRDFLNDNLMRTQLSMRASDIVFERIEQDYQAYLLAYRNSIERCT